MDPMPGIGERMGERIEAAMATKDRAAIKKAATEFESFFLYYMMKTMRQAVPQGGLLESKHTDTYLGLLDQEVAKRAAQRGGLGLAQAIERQLLRPPPRAILSSPMPVSSLQADLPITGGEREGMTHERLR